MRRTLETIESFVPQRHGSVPSSPGLTHRPEGPSVALPGGFLPNALSFARGGPSMTSAGAAGSRGVTEVGEAPADKPPSPVAGRSPAGLPRE
jgi:hypothetical protein